jgi:hypothetical protein
MTNRLSSAATLVVLLASGIVAARPADAQTNTTRETRAFEILSVDGNVMVVRENTGTHEYTVPDDFRFVVDGKPLGIRDLRAGMKGTATVTTTVTSKPVYVTEVKSGEVYQVSGASVVVRGEDGFHMYSPGDVEKRGIKIYMDGKRVELSDLRKGDKLTATIVTEGPRQQMTEQQVQATLASAADAAGSAVNAAAGAAAGAAASAAQAAAAAAASAARAPAATASQAAESAATGAGGSGWMLWVAGLVLVAVVAFFLLRGSR